MKLTREDIEGIAFVTSYFANVAVEKVNISKIQCKGWHSRLEDKELIVYSDKLEKKEVVSKISNVLSKHSIKSKKQIEEFMLSIN